MNTTTVSDLAKQTRADRNRAVDAYRAVAMLAVAFGHWAAVAAFVDDGELIAGNALAYAPSMAWMTWLLQVMPLFFVVGGYASAVSLDSFAARGKGTGADWVAIRLRRMLAPTLVLAGVWAGAFAVGGALGVGGLVGMAAVAAAIPLWFLANYTIDTAIAPVLRPRFKQRPGLVSAGLLGVFTSVSILHAVGVPHVGHVNWVVGWLLFQVAGFAWRDGLLPTGRTLVAVAGGFWAAAVGAVAFGPWPVAMVHFPGLAHSPTHPPSPALVLFGAAYSATAVAFAPRVSDWLAARPKAWSAVVAANGIAMSVYLWHMTAATAAIAVVWKLGLLPTAAVGSAAWYVQKLPLIGLSAVILIGIVAVVARFERDALFAAPTSWKYGNAAMVVSVVAISSLLKLWTGGSATAALIGSAGVLVLGRTVFVRPAAAPAVEVV